MKQDFRRVNAATLITYRRLRRLDECARRLPKNCTTLPAQLSGTRVLRLNELVFAFRRRCVRSSRRASLLSLNVKRIEKKMIDIIGGAARKFMK